MASIVVRLQPKPRIRKPQLNLRSLCSSAASPSNEPPASGDDSSTPLASDIADIRARLRQSSAPTRRIPLNPPKPDVLGASSRKVASLEEIRKNLAAFRSRSSAPDPAKTSSSGNISLMDLFNKSTADNTSDGGGAKADSIRQSLQRLPRTSGESRGTHGRSRGPQYGLGSIGAITERLNIQPRQGPSRSEQLPHSIFGKELVEEEEEGSKERKTELLQSYNHRQLGEKLGQLRPREGKGSFSLQELNERLAKLRRMEEKQMQSNIGNMFGDLRSTLSKLKDAKDAKKQTINDLSFLAHLGGFAPKYMMGEPKEHLVEKYFHPDLMSSEEKLKMELKKVRDEFKMSESDCGSARVQVAQLTTKIKHLSTVLHKKDKHSLKGLQAMVQRRKKLLKYLRRTDWDSYCFVLSKLGLRDAADYRISAA